MTESKLNAIASLIGKALHIWAVQYHFVIPREILKMYIDKFTHERRNIARYGCRFFDPHDGEQYRKWLSFRTSALDPSKKRNDITAVAENALLDLSAVHTEYALIVSEGCQLYPGYASVLPEEGDVIYFDHDRTDDAGQRFEPVLKPDFSYNTLRSFNYIGRCFAVKTELLRQFEGEPWNPYRWVLQLSDQTKKITHVSEIVYADQKSFACEAETLREYLSQSNTRAAVRVNADQISCTVEYETQGNPLISIIIPTKDGLDVLRTCVDSIFRKTVWPRYEIIIADNNSEKQETLDYFRALKEAHDNVQVVRVDAPFNFSYINNRAAEYANGEYFVLLNNDTEVISPDWLDQMAGYAQRYNVGTVGVKLYYEDGTIQHGGVIIGKGGAAAHRWYRCEKDVRDYLFTLSAPNDVGCVTAACMMTSRKCWQEMNGLNEELAVQYNDVDYGLRLLKAGYFNVFLPSVELYHYESKSRGIDTDRKAVKRFFEEVNWFKEHYAAYIIHDPFYNDGFDKSYDYMLIASSGRN